MYFLTNILTKTCDYILIINKYKFVSYSHNVENIEIVITFDCVVLIILSLSLKQPSPQIIVNSLLHELTHHSTGRTPINF